ncbi:MAG: hypothetical protein H6Q06_554, partial [Acidobacteria bacterium]|nr:hypothetical protein [Acidobacteriota bacterium]
EKQPQRHEDRREESLSDFESDSCLSEPSVSAVIFQFFTSRIPVSNFLAIRKRPDRRPRGSVTATIRTNSGKHPGGSENREYECQRLEQPLVDVADEQASKHGAKHHHRCELQVQHE